MIEHLPSSARTRLQNLMDASLGIVFPACSLVVIKNGTWVVDTAWGTIEDHPATPETLFDLASITKLFTVTAFLSLVSAGNVGLHDPLASVIPEFAAHSPRSVDGGQDPHSKIHLPTPEHLLGKTVDPSLVTFWHLLTHTSGLPAWRDVYNAAGPAPVPPDEVDPIPKLGRWSRAVKALCAYPFIDQPGEKVVYSDIGLMLLGEAVARLDGRPLDMFISQKVLKPVGLTKARFNPVREGHLSREHIAPTENDPTWRKRRVWGEVHDENACGVGGVAGHAGLFSTAHEVACFGEAWLNEPDAVFGIAPELAAEAKRQQAETDGARRGLGFAVKAREGASTGDKFSLNTYGHTGFTGTSLWIDPDNRLIVSCLTNSVYEGREKGGLLEFRRSLHDLLAEELN